MNTYFKISVLSKLDSYFTIIISEKHINQEEI